jgi:hypothetical protein
MFAATVERWRSSAREHAAWAAARYHVALDESDVLAVIRHESTTPACPSGGDPTAVSSTGCRGLGQFAHGTLKDYNGDNPGHELTWDDMIDPGHADGQIRAIAWCMASSRKVVSSWEMPDAKSAADLWGSVRYGWGGGHLKKAIAGYKADHGHAPTFDQLEASSPAAYDESGDGQIDIQPFIYARAIRKLAAKDRGEVPAPSPAPFLVAGADAADRFVGCCCAARRSGGRCPLGDGTKAG